MVGCHAVAFLGTVSPVLVAGAVELDRPMVEQRELTRATAPALPPPRA